MNDPTRTAAALARRAHERIAGGHDSSPFRTQAEAGHAEALTSIAASLVAIERHLRALVVARVGTMNEARAAAGLSCLRCVLGCSLETGHEGPCVAEIG